MVVVLSHGSTRRESGLRLNSRMLLPAVGDFYNYQ